MTGLGEAVYLGGGRLDCSTAGAGLVIFNLNTDEKIGTIGMQLEG